MSNKKTVLAGAVALVVVGYAGLTWYTGQRAQAGYQEGVAELRKLLGEQAVVADEYHKGFFSSKARLVLQWTPPQGEKSAKGQEGEDSAQGEIGASVADESAKPLRLAVNSDVRHGPLAGGRLAAAVIQSRFSFEGLDDKSAQVLAKATGPTLTSVHHLLGGNDVHMVLPAGEIGDSETTMRWQEMVLDTSLSSGNKRIKGTWRWPELALIGVPDKSGQDSVAQADEEEEDEDGGQEDGQPTRQAQDVAPPVARTTVTFTGLESSFDNQLIEGLWAMGPGTASVRMARMGVSSLPADGGATRTLLDLKDIVGTSVAESDGKTLGMTTQFKGAGLIGPIDFDSVGYEQKIQRLDIEALRNLQRALIESYRAEGLVKAAEGMESQTMAVLQENAPRLVAALPAYVMKINATYKGQTGQIEYGGEIKSAPPQEQVAAMGWMPVLFKNTALHANASLPKAWLEPLLKAKSGSAEVKPEEVDALLGMAQATGYARIEGDHLTSALKMQDGQLTINGKAVPLPMGMLQ